MDSQASQTDPADLHPLEIDPPQAMGGIWVFAYGSLMWQPDFPYAEVRPALLRGYHRSLCVYSVRYRGTPEKPGLVLGLDRGGACSGRAYRVNRCDWEAVREYLYSREMVTRTYEPRFVNVRLDCGTRVPAYAFVVRRDHPQYTGNMPEEQIVELVRRGVGARGRASEYLANTVAHLNACGIADGLLHRILAMVEADRA